MGAYQWKWSVIQLQEISQFEEKWCAAGEENAWLEQLSGAAREAFHRFIARDFDCGAQEMEALCLRLQEATQLHYFDKVRRTGEDALA